MTLSVPYIYIYAHNACTNAQGQRVPMHAHTAHIYIYVHIIVYIATYMYLCIHVLYNMYQTSLLLCFSAFMFFLLLVCLSVFLSQNFTITLAELSR